MAGRLPYLPPSIGLRYQVAGTRGSCGAVICWRSSSCDVGMGRWSAISGDGSDLRTPTPGPRPCVLSLADMLITVKGFLVYCQQSCLAGEL